MKLMNKFMKKHEGFTLVELIVVIAILAILAGVAVPVYSGYIKKANSAADLQLLDAVNTAFAAACVANGDDVSQINGAYIGLNEDKTINLDSVEPYGEDFAKFFSGNEGNAFKSFAGIYFNLEQHAFVEGSAAYMNALNTILTTMPDQVTLVQASQFAAMGANKLMGAVGGVTNLATEMLANSDSTLSQMVYTDAYMDNLQSILQLTDAEFDALMEDMGDNAGQFMANSTVLSVATTVNSDSYDRDALTNKLATGKLSEVAGAITSSENGLAEAALIYGLYTAYAPDKAGEVTGSAGLQALANDKDGFMAYLATLSDPDSQASKDLNGYYAALDIVNNAVSEDPEVANQVLVNGYEDEELVGIIGSIIGG